MSIDMLQKNITRYAAARLIAGMLATLALGGCGNWASTRIEATDNRTFLPALRANINFGDEKQAASEPHTGHAIEIGIAKARGSDSQSLSAAQLPISLSNTSFTGPQLLQNEFDTSFANISWRWRKFFAERSLGLEVTAGVGFSSLDLSVSSTSQRASDHFFSRGPQASVGLIWRLNPGTSLHGRVSEFISLANHGVNEMSRYELYFAKSLHENLALRAGYASWDVSARDQYYNSNSDFQLRVSGPMLALDWDFDTGSKNQAP